MKTPNLKALHVRQCPPDDASLVHILGRSAYDQLGAAQNRLQKLGFQGGWSWGGQILGWVRRFQSGDTTLCSLVLSSAPLTAQVTIGQQQLDIIRASGLLPASIERQLEASPLRGSQHTITVRLDSGTGLSQLTALVEAKLKSAAKAKEP